MQVFVLMRPALTKFNYLQSDMQDVWTCDFQTILHWDQFTVNNINTLMSDLFTQKMYYTSLLKNM